MSRTGRRFALLAVLAACGALVCLHSGAGAGVVGSPHDFSLSKPSGYTHDSAQLAPNGVCSPCHIPHGAYDNVLWRRDLTDYTNNGTGKLDIRDGRPSGEQNFLLPATVQCYDCHDLHGGGSIETTSTPALSLFDDNHEPQNILSGFRKNSVGSMTEDAFGSTSTLKIPGFFETNPLGSSSNYGVNLSAPLSETGGHYFKQDPVTSGALGSVYDNGSKLPCTDCHDPHAWNSNGQWQAFIRETWPTGAVSGRLSGQARASEDMANAFYPASPGRDNNASRAICAACHGYSNTTPVNFSDIQSYYRSVAITGLPATITEHASSSQVACVTCHVHNSIGANCSQCHGFPPSPYPPTRGATPPVPYPSGDPHGRHVGRNDGQAPGSIPPYGWECKVCHATSVLGSRTQSGVHQDNAMSIAYDFSSLGVANPPNTVSAGGLTCGNVYCHSNGGSDNTMGGAGNYFRSPQWGTTASLRCNGCHGSGTTDNVIQTGMPNYVSGSGGSATANSHSAHVLSNRFDCSVCHFDTAQGNYPTGRSIKSSPLKHVNGVREVVFDGTTAVGGTTPYTGGTDKRCAVSCHNSQALPLPQQPQWGNPASSTCSSCHLSASADSDAYLNGTDTWFQDNTTATLDNTEWAWAGHGRTAAQGSYDVSLRPAANLLGGGTGTNACIYCHDPNVGHRTATNPFRLKQQDNVSGYSGWGWNATCMICHSKTPAPPGYDPDNTAVYANRVATAAFVDNNHYGTKHGTGNNGGKFCWDCHDPHGDRKSGGPGNIYMIHKQRLARQTEGIYGFLGSTGAQTSNAPVFTNVTTGTNYADNTTRLGICQVCHLTTGHYTATSGDGHNAAKRCTDCHLHDAAFKGFGGPDAGQYFDNVATSGQNYDDRSSHPLRGLTTADNSLRFGGSENCLACHYGSVSGKTTDECLMCHFENNPGSSGALGSFHMDNILQLANPTTAGSSTAPTSAYTVSGINDFDAWCLLCHDRASPPALGGKTATGIMRKQYFADGEHRANSVGCIYCHHPHGRTNAKIARENPSDRRNGGGTPRKFGVYPNEDYGGTQNVAYLADGSGRAYADNNTNYCNLACHQGTPSANKRKYVDRVNASGWYVLSGINKSYVDGSATHVHVNDEIINTDNIVKDYAAMRGITGPSYYKYPGTSSSLPSAYTDNASFPFYPDFDDSGTGFRDFPNAYNSLGMRIVYRFTCSTCHDAHGTSISGQGVGTPDLRLQKNKELCNMCHK